jgi:peptide/nickel transport system permease protein
MSVGVPDAMLPHAAAAAGGSPGRLLWRRLRRDRVAMAALAFVVALAVVALLAPLVVKLLGVPGPDVRDRDAVDAFGTPLGPSADHPLGVDDFGRDVLSRIVYGARLSLFVGVVATAIAVALGVLAGLLAGWYRGWVDTVVSRAVDAMLSFPILLLGLGIASACSFGEGCVDGAIAPGVRTVVLVIAIVAWTYMARIVRGEVLSLREREFVQAARVTGHPDRWIMIREILPNLVAPIVVYSSLMIPQTILFEAALSFLGVGVSPSTPSWGAMIADAAPNFDTQWWFMLFPGIALLLTVLAFNLLGDGLRDALDPKALHR